MFRLRPHHFFEFSEPSLLAPLKAQVGLIYDRYKTNIPIMGCFFYSQL